MARMKFFDWIAKKQLPPIALVPEVEKLTAEDEGYLAGVSGAEVWENPLSNPLDRGYMDWQRGWCRGRQSRAKI